MRIIAAFFAVLQTPAGSRPNSILKLQFGDVNVKKRRDPGGPDNTMIDFTPRFTKEYLGLKEE
jgi:hypothetical protein